MSTEPYTSRPLNAGQLYKTSCDQMLGNTTQRSKVANLVSNGVLLVVFAMGCAGLSSCFSGGMLGWCVVGLGTLYLAIKLLGGNLNHRHADVILSTFITSVLVTLGGLGVGGILSCAQLGYALISGTCVLLPATCCAMIITKKLNRGLK